MVLNISVPQRFLHFYKKYGVWTKEPSKSVIIYMSQPLSYYMELVEFFSVHPYSVNIFGIPQDIMRFCRKQNTT